MLPFYYTYILVVNDASVILSFVISIAVLHCLGFIHSKGFVHRDIRWSNIIKLVTYTPENVASVRFMIIDFEFAVNDGDAMEINNCIHNRIVNYGENYMI